MDPEALFRLLLDEGWVEAADLERLLEDYESGNQDLFDFLEASGVGSKHDVLRAVAAAHGWDSVDIGEFEFLPDLSKSISRDLIRIYRCLPIHDSPDVLKVCFVDPLDDVAIDELQKILDRRIEVVIADPHEVEARVQAIVDGSSLDSSTIGVAPFGAFEVASNTAQVQVPQLSHGRGIRMIALSLLAAAAVAVASLHVRQEHSAQAVKVVLKDIEAFEEAHALSRKSWEQEVRDIELELEKMGSLLKRNETEAAKLAQLEAGIQRLEGKLEGLSEIKSAGESGDEATVVQDGTSE